MSSNDRTKNFGLENRYIFEEVYQGCRSDVFREVRRIMADEGGVVYAQSVSSKRLYDFLDPHVFRQEVFGMLFLNNDHSFDVEYSTIVYEQLKDDIVFCRMGFGGAIMRDAESHVFCRDSSIAIRIDELRKNQEIVRRFAKEGFRKSVGVIETLFGMSP